MAWNPNIPTVTNRVQDDLNAIRENFQHLDPLAQAVGELQAVSELAPYVQAILDSRIVEMGSNSNGEYVRWENGLQICAVTISETVNINLSSAFGGYYGNGQNRSWPASFAAIWAYPSALGGVDGVTANVRTATTLSFTPVYRAINSVSELSVTCTIIGIGRWK